LHACEEGMAGVGRGRQAAAVVAKMAEAEVVAKVTEAEEEEEEYGDDLVAYFEDPPTEAEARLLTRWMFPSKVGGRPAWLVPRSLPSAVAASASAGGVTALAPSGGDCPDLGCRTCGRPLRFLLQIYASQGSLNPDAFHRTLMLFVCTSCQPNEVRIFRSQLNWENEFYGGERPDPTMIGARLRKTNNADPELDPLLCSSCGLPRDARGGEAEAQADRPVCCAECARRARYKDPPATFQELELTTTDAEEPEEPDEDVPAAAPTSSKDDAEEIVDGDEIEEVYTDGAKHARGGGRDLLAEADAVIASAKSKGASAAVLEKLEEYKSKVAENEDHAIDSTEQAVFDEYSKEQGEHDPVFSKYNRFAAANVGHAVRYNFGGRPLWFCGPNAMQGPVPACQHCGAPRTFEAQVQSMLISHLRGSSALADRLDFGAVFCFTCSASCTPPADRPYVEEFAFVQAEPREAWLPKV